MADPQASTVEDKRRLLQILILGAAVATSIIISLVSFLDVQIRIIVIVAEALSAIVLFFVIGRVIK